MSRRRIRSAETHLGLAILYLTALASSCYSLTHNHAWYDVLLAIVMLVVSPFAAGESLHRYIESRQNRSET